MNHNSYDDLEEGEIADVIVLPNSKKFETGRKREHKTLPRQYILNRNDISPNVKHKKCKHFVKLNSENQSLKKDLYLKKSVAHRKTGGKNHHACLRHRSNIPKKKNLVHKNFSTHFSNTKRPCDNTYIKSTTFPLQTNGSHENHSSDKPPMRPRAETFYSHAGSGDALNINSSFEDLLADYKNIQAELKNLTQENKNILNKIKSKDQCHAESLTRKNSLHQNNRSNSIKGNIQEKASHEKPKIQAKKNVCDKILPDSTTKHYANTPESPESDEDEEELRKKALASCLKHSVSVGNANFKSTGEKHQATFPENPSPSCNTFSGVPIASLNIPNTDNYDLVDMELDEEHLSNVIEVNKCKYPENEELFVIDTKPSVPVDSEVENKDLKNACALAPKSSPVLLSSYDADEDFEETLLRAQLILSMNKKKSLKFTSKDDSDKISDCTKTNSNEKAVSNEGSPLPRMSLPKPLNMNKEPCLSAPVKRVVSNSKVSCVNGASINTSKVYMPQKRIVIKLTAESTSDESDEGENINSNAAFASLEALISNARQKSNETVADAVHAPVAVSCLSKAQQKEYNELKKLIAQKESFQIHQKLVHSSSDDLKLLEKKLIMTLAAFQKEKQLMSMMKTDVAKKRSSYVTSQLAVQRLKEQQLAAERLKKTNVQMLSKATSQLQIVQSSVSKRQALICDLRRECAKLGASVRGSNYVLPSVAFPSANRTPKIVRKVSLSKANLLKHV